MRILLAILLLTTLSMCDEALYEQGSKLYFAKGCSGCHGTKAEGIGSNPFLANRAKGYLAKKLKRFREGKPENQQQEIMISFAINLSDEEIDALTTYLNEWHESMTEGYNPAYETWGDGGS